MTFSASTTHGFYKNRPELICSPYSHSLRTAAWTGARISLRGKQLLALSDIAQAGRILDVGCGTGHLLAELALQDSVQANKRELHGVDLDDFRGPLARQTLRHHVADVDRDRLPFEDEYFDVVLCTEVVEHLAQPTHAVHEMARVLRRGGLAVFSAPSYLNVAGLCKVAFEWLRLYDVDAWAPFSRWAYQYRERRMTVIRLRRLLDACGFVVETATTFWHLDGLVPFLMLLPERVCFGRLCHWLRNAMDSILPNQLPTGLQCVIICRRRTG